MSTTEKKRSHFATVGIKILVSVTLASNLFIGTLLYVHLQSTDNMAARVVEVLAIKEKLSANLRMAIVALQNEFLSLPNFLQVDSRGPLLSTIKQTFDITDHKVLKGRESYSHLFDRKERRDLAHNIIILQEGADNLTLSLGITDENGVFSDTVEQLVLASKTPSEDAARIRTQIDTILTESSNGTLLRQRINDFNTHVADAGLKAENTRNEILQHVEEIRNMEHNLQTLHWQQRRFSLLMGGLAIFANMLVLFFLVRSIVEKPLYKLTSTIDAINLGKLTDIPYLQRRDQIGVLSAAINNFRKALMTINDDNLRKTEEKLIVEKVLVNIADIINSLNDRAKGLVDTADSLKSLANSTENRAENVSIRADETAKHTEKISEATLFLQSALHKLALQTQHQNENVTSLLENNLEARQLVTTLNSSLLDIEAIIAGVEGITDQTKLLSLNATIEAARAGESGKGFSVVAEEIKALSLKTAMATGHAQEKIGAIEAARSVLLKHLEDVDSRMQVLQRQTVAISEAVAGQRSVTETISELTLLTSGNTHKVSTSIAEVRNGASTNRNTADNLHDASQEISGQLTSLLQTTNTHLQQLIGDVNPSFYLPASPRL